MTPYERIDTPSLLIDLDRAEKNIRDMQAYADKMGVKLRPHTKTHKMPGGCRRLWNCCGKNR